MQKLESRRQCFQSHLHLYHISGEICGKKLIKKIISSEESSEDFDGKRHPALAVKSLLWSAPKVDRFFKYLDQRSDKEKTKHSKQ